MLRWRSGRERGGWRGAAMTGSVWRCATPRYQDGLREGASVVEDVGKVEGRARRNGGSGPRRPGADAGSAAGDRTRYGSGRRSGGRRTCGPSGGGGRGFAGDPPRRGGGKHGRITPVLLRRGSPRDRSKDRCNRTQSYRFRALPGVPERWVGWFVLSVRFADDLLPRFGQCLEGAGAAARRRRRALAHGRDKRAAVVEVRVLLDSGGCGLGTFRTENNPARATTQPPTDARTFPAEEHAHATVTPLDDVEMVRPRPNATHERNNAPWKCFVRSTPLRTTAPNAPANPPQPNDEPQCPPRRREHGDHDK